MVLLLRECVCVGGGAFCCYWRQTGIPDKCENVSKLGREAGEVLEVKFGLLGHHYSYCVAVTSSKNPRYIFDDPVNDFHSFFFFVRHWFCFTFQVQELSGWNIRTLSNT